MWAMKINVYTRKLMCLRHIIKSYYFQCKNIIIYSGISDYETDAQIERAAQIYFHYELNCGYM
jgi:hypothetical protein